MTRLEKNGKHEVAPRLASLLVMCLTLVNAGCGQDLVEPVEPDFGKVKAVSATGALQVTVVTTGPLLDPDGYFVRVDGRQHQLITINGSVIYTALPVGEHIVDLKNVWGKCSVVDGNTRTVTITEGMTTSLAFEVSCPTAEPPAETGVLKVTTVTTGDLLDPDGYIVRVDGRTRQEIGLNATVTYSAIPVGEHTVDLKNVWGKCLVVGGNTQPVTITAGATTLVTFEVDCQSVAPPPVTGVLEVTTATTGDVLDPDGYVVRVDGGTRQEIGLNATVIYDALAVGDHLLELKNVLGVCVVEGGATRWVTVTAGAEVEILFNVSCPVIEESSG